MLLHRSSAAGGGHPEPTLGSWSCPRGAHSPGPGHTGAERVCGGGVAAGSDTRGLPQQRGHGWDRQTGSGLGNTTANKPPHGNLNSKALNLTEEHQAGSSRNAAVGDAAGP